jgi:hypothetical protein
MHASAKLRLYCLIIAFLTLTLSALAQNPTASSSAPSAIAQVPRLIRFSAVAKDESGKPMTGTVGVTFSLYEDAEGGAPLWLETQNVQADATGHYTALLGSASAEGVPLTIFASAKAQYVAARISGQPEQARVLLMSVPYALKAVDAQTLGGLPASAFMPANLAARAGKAGASPAPPAGSLPAAGVTGKGTKDFVPLWTSGTALGNSVIFQTGGNLGVGTKTPKANLDLVGKGKFGIRATAPGTQAAIWGVATATSGAATGVAGTSPDPGGNGVFGLDSAKTGGVGVVGISSATSGVTAGVLGLGQSKTTGASGVAGYESATTGQVFGVTGGTNSTTDFSVGVSGVEGAATGAVFGVAGAAFSTTDGATAVSGFESASTGAVVGVAGATSSVSGTGVIGNATATSGPTIGVRGVSASPAGAAGVFLNLSGGSSQVLVGQGGNFVQVFTVDAGGNGFYAGNLNVTGKLTKGSGSFKIDHPLDPANKYLSHSFVESPDMMNVYNGNITTDKHGMATVILPSYFEALNADFRYQLTVIGQFAQAMVQQEIRSNQFTIKTNKPGVKVSWQVTGIRHDAYANADRIPVEEDKPSAERGYYLHPEAFGQPVSKSVQAADQKLASGPVLAEAQQK